MHIQKVIEQFGYRPNTARVYLAGLQLGEATIADIAAKVKLPRTSVQVIVDELHKDGLMNFYVKKRYRYWIAENPEKLLIRNRERDASLRAVMPELAALRKKGGAKPTAKVFGGPEEIGLILEDMIATKHNILALIAWDEWARLFGTEYMTDLISNRVRHFLRMRMLTPKSDLSQKLKSKDSRELRETRFLPERFAIRTTNFIYGNKVAIISLNEKRPTGVLIEDEDVKDTMTVFFEALWERSS